jgi:hypothetical protein
MRRVQIYVGPEDRLAVHRPSLARFTNFSHLQLLSMTSVCAHSGRHWLSFLQFAGFTALLH